MSANIPSVALSPCQHSSHTTRSLLLSYGAAGLFALATYLLTLAPDLTWANYGGDGGELITAAVTLGVPHPPGYPTYVLLGKLASYLPVGTVAYRFNLISAISMALAVAFLAARPWEGVGSRETGTRAGGRPQGTPLLSSLAAALLFGWSPLVWSQAVIAEVYSLHLAFLAVLLWTLLSRRAAWLVGLLLGLSLTTHLTALLMLPLCLLLVAPRRWPQLAGGLLAGLLPFLAIPLLARSGSPVQWGEPTSVAGWWWLVSGRLYSSNVFALPAADAIARLAEWAPILLRQLGGAGWLVLLLSAWQVAHDGLHSRLEARAPLVGAPTPARPGDSSKGLLVTLSPCHLVTLTAVAYLLYALTYTSADAIVFSLPALLLISHLLKGGLSRLGAWSLVLPLLALAINFGVLMNNDGVPVRARAEQLFREAPPSALLLTNGDPALFTLWYFHHVEGRRPDLLVVDSHLLAFDWYRSHLKQRHPQLLELERDDLERFQVANSQLRPICQVSARLALGACTDNHH